jgi:hypothetical protein
LRHRSCAFDPRRFRNPRGAILFAPCGEEVGRLSRAPTDTRAGPVPR